MCGEITAGFNVFILHALNVLYTKQILFSLLSHNFLRLLLSSCLFYRQETSKFRPCSPSLEDAILDSKLENVQRFQVCYAQKHMPEI